MNTCATCKWWLGYGGAEAIEGMCRRFPPTVVVVNEIPADRRPMTMHNSMCGEHSPIPKPKAESDSEYSADFLVFWAAYPDVRKTKKHPSWLKWQAAIKRGVKPEAILEAVREFAKSPMGQGEYCPGPLPWLNARSWEDDRNVWWQERDSLPKKKLPELPEE